MRHPTDWYLAIVVMACVAAASSAAVGGDPKAQPAPRIAPRTGAEIVALMDSDGDGRISSTEFRINIIKLFVELDENRDRYLVREELPGISTETFATVDVDMDGKISGYEFAYSEFGRFRSVDLNSDRFITAEEIESFIQRLKKQ